MSYRPLGDYDREIAAQEAMIEMNRKMNSGGGDNGGGDGGGSGCGCAWVIPVLIILGLLVWFGELIYMST